MSSQSFAARVELVRGLAELNQRELSELAGLSPSLVWAIENGSRSSPTARTLSSLSAVLGVSLDWLAHGKGVKPTREAVKRAVRRAQRSVSTGTDG